MEWKSTVGKTTAEQSNQPESFLPSLSGRAEQSGAEGRSNRSQPSTFTSTCIRSRTITHKSMKP